MLSAVALSMEICRDHALRAEPASAGSKESNSFVALRVIFTKVLCWVSKTFF